MGCWLGAVPIDENRAARSCIAFLCLGVCPIAATVCPLHWQQSILRSAALLPAVPWHRFWNPLRCLRAAVNLPNGISWPPFCFWALFPCVWLPEGELESDPIFVTLKPAFCSSGNSEWWFVGALVGWTSKELAYVHKGSCMVCCFHPHQETWYVVSKLIPRLSGPARLLAMSWSRTEFWFTWWNSESFEEASWFSPGLQDPSEHSCNSSTVLGV